LRAVITGCGGFIGSHLSERLLADGATILGIDSITPTYDTAVRAQRCSDLARSSRFEFIGGDINQLDLRPLFADADVVFHLAARPGVRASWADFRQVSEANVVATQRILDALVGLPDRRMVFASSSSVYGRPLVFPTPEEQTLAPISPYGVTKAAGEALCSAYATEHGLRIASLRYFTVYGPRQRSDMAFTRWIKAACEGRPLPLYGDGTAVRDFTFVSDVVEATILAAGLELPGHSVFNVAGGNAATLGEVFELIGNLTGATLTFDRLGTAKGDPAQTTGDTTRIHQTLGWQPKVGLEEGLTAQVGWIRQLQR
jgi:UDP-glucuronate 4-epimerase